MGQSINLTDHFVSAMTPNTKLAAIEFGELGSYSDPTGHELNNTIQLLKNRERPWLVVFIQGWQRIRY